MCALRNNPNIILFSPGPSLFPLSADESFDFKCTYIKTKYVLLIPETVFFVSVNPSS